MRNLYVMYVGIYMYIYAWAEPPFFKQLFEKASVEFF